jgi:hypothetical protein
MLSSTHLKRSSIAALVIAGLMTSPALARPEGAPLTTDAVVQSVGKDYSKNAAAGDFAGSTGHDLRSPVAKDPQHGGTDSMPPRVDGMGVKPIALVAPQPRVRVQDLSVATDGEGLDWASVALGASVVLALVLLAAMARAVTARGATHRVGRA